MKRKLGDIEISAMGMGCWAIGGPFWAGEQPVGWSVVDDDESIRAIHRGLELGVNFLDTADVYGAGHSERILAKALKGKRQDVVIATKFSNLFDEETKQMTGQSFEPVYVKQACDASLQRLQTDYIDLYQLHHGAVSLEQAAPTRDVLEELVREGKIRAYGWSTDDHERAAFFQEGEHCVAVQHDMNVFNDKPEMIELCERTGMTSILRGPLAMGLLTGKYDANSRLPDDDVRGKEPEWLVYFKDGRPTDEWLRRLDSLRDILTSEGRTLAQGALAWLWARSAQNIPIPGFKTVKQIEENARAMEFGPLKPDQMQEIETILGRVPA